MILTGSATKGAVSLILVGSLLAVSCDQKGTPTEEKKESIALEEIVVKTAPKLIRERQSLLSEKKYMMKKKPTTLEEKPIRAAKSKRSKKKSVVAKKTVVSKKKSSLNKRTATASYSAPSEERTKHSFVANISAYTASAEEGTAGGRTASGRKAREGRTIAMSRDIPIGTKVKIEGLPDVYVVEDRGGAIQRNKVDLFVGSKAEARKWGRQHRKVHIIEWGDGKVD